MTLSMSFAPFSRSPKLLDAPAAVGFVAAELDAYANEFIAEVRGYPPVPAGSRYVRTGILGGGWSRTAVRTGGDLVVVVDNLTEYAMWVVGRFQRGYHAAHGWPNAPELWRRKSGALRGRMQRAIERGLRQR